MSYYEMLERAERIYRRDGKKSSLLAAGRDLAEIVKSEYATEENKARAEELLSKLRLKDAFLAYMTELDAATYTSLTRAIDAVKKSKYDSSYALACRLDDCLSSFATDIEDVTRIYYGLFDEMGELSISSKTDTLTLRRVVEKRRANIAAEEIVNPFGDEVSMPDIRRHLVEKIDTVLAQMDTHLRDYLDHNFGERYEEITTLHGREELPYLKDGYLYYPHVFREDDSDRVRVLHTPYLEEARLLVAAAAGAVRHGLAEVSLVQATDYPSEFWSYFSERISGERDLTDILVTGVKQMRDYSVILTSLYDHAVAHGVYVYFADSLSDGSPSVYRDFYRLSEGGRMNMLYVSYHYLSMPSFGETVELLRHCGRLTDPADERYLRDNCKFMGFIGLNRIMHTSGTGVACLNAGRLVSEDNRRAVDAYVTALPSRLQFIDGGWGEIDGVTFSSRRNASREFDYDALDEFDRRNVEVILKNERSTYPEKCGQVVKYALLQNNDVSTWAQLDREEKEERVTRAVHLLCHTLNTEFRDPVVEFSTIKREPNSAISLNGYCSDSGRRIVIANTVLRTYDIDSIQNLICHEVYHSFQHTLVRCGWQEWHLHLLGVTESRVERWKENFDNKYQTGDDSFAAYFVQIVEADARSFEEETARGNLDAWSTIQFR